MASVISRTKGCQFRLKYENVEYTDKPLLDTHMYAPYILPIPITGKIYIRTNSLNAVRKLIILNKKHQPYSLSDTSKNIIYKGCYIEEIKHIDLVEDPKDVDRKFDIRIAFSNVEPRANK